MPHKRRLLEGRTERKAKAKLLHMLPAVST
jgi:hypothetical protein